MTTGPQSSRQLANMQRLFATPFADIYVLYVAKIERKCRSVEDLREIITWLTGFDETELDELIASRVSCEEFFSSATLNEHASMITGTICGVKVQEVVDPLMRQIRYLDKLVDELAQGKALEKILRTPAVL